jgi:predicted N-acyltransferase
VRWIPTIYDRVADVPPGDWSKLIKDPYDLAMDRRLLAAFESTLGGQCRCWYVVFRDDDGECLALACLALFQIDALETTGPVGRAFTRRIRLIMPGYMRFGVLFCGLPLPSGASHLRYRADIDRNELLVALDALLREQARANRARLVVIKELDNRQSAELPGLSNRGYIRGEIPVAYEFKHQFISFADYFNALRSNYRKQITRSQKRLAKAGGSIEFASGAAICDHFTDEVHALYLAVRNQAKYRMETLPREFFHEVGRRFGENASLTLCRLGGRVVGFTFGITVGREYHDLYIGIDYARNAEADVYFNLYYHDLDRIFRSGCTRVHLGQTSDEFKMRLGCQPRELSFYVRAVNPIVHAGLRRIAKWVFPPVTRAEPREIYLAANTANCDSAVLAPGSKKAPVAPL